jgi:serine/threonine-protein kinase
MREIGREKKCPHCGFSADSVQVSPYLPIRTVVGGRYLIGKLLEYNGEGATYIAHDSQTGRTVCVREFFPLDLVKRMINGVDVVQLSQTHDTYEDCYRSFRELWVKLARLHEQPGLVRVTHVLEDNNTIYAVHEHLDGITLREFLLGSRTGYISWDKARQLLMPVLDALEALHASGIIHRGLSPHTLILGRDGRIRISGFCIPQVRTARSELKEQLFPGYAAIEQYGYKGQQGPWTDVYAFGAVLYRALIGTDPIEATTRVTNDRLMVPGRFAEQLPAYVINGLVNSLQIMPEDRTRTVEQFHAEITASPSASVAEEHFVESRRAMQQPEPRRGTAQTTQKPPKKKKAKSGLRTAFLTAMICVLVGFVGFVLVSLYVLPEEYNVFRDILEKEPVTETVSDAAGQYTVPDFRTKSYTEVIVSDYYKSRFRFSKTDVYSDDVELGYIIDQSVAAGTPVPAGTEIRLTVSKGMEKITLPNVLGQDYAQAYETLTGLGFVVSKSERANDGTRTGGTVIQMSKDPEMQYEKGTHITLQVYAEPITEATTTTTTEPTTTTTTLPPETDPETVPYEPGEAEEPVNNEEQ